MSVWALVGSILTFGFAVVASYGCFYVTVQVPTDSKYLSGASTGFGLFSRSGQYVYIDDDIEVSSGCVAWSSNEAEYFFDSEWITALAFGYIANITSGIALVFSLLMMCMSFTRTLINVFTGLLILSFISLCLTFIAFSSKICKDMDCRFSVGAGLAIGGIISALITILIFSNIPPPREIPGPNNDIFMGDPPGTVTVQETINPDGTKTTVKTTVNADGSKTIEETIEAPQQAQAY